MAFKVGDRTWLSPSQRPGEGARVSLRKSCSASRRPRYRIRWNDGHETIYTRERRPSSRTSPQAGTQSATTETLIQPEN